MPPTHILLLLLFLFQVARFSKVTARASGEAPSGRTNSSRGLLELGSSVALRKSSSSTALAAVVVGFDARVFVVNWMSWCRKINVAKAHEEGEVIKFPKAGQSADACHVVLADLWTLSVSIGLRWQFMHRLCMRKLL